MNYLMTNENVRVYWYDKLLAKTVLRLIPRDIHPNHLTILRVIMTPFILYYLWLENWNVVVPFFLFAALTDLFDGSLARTRKQITTWGTIADPIADKLLIASVVILFVAKEINVYFAGVIVFVEASIATMAVVRKIRGNPFISANWYGKMKMLFQVMLKLILTMLVTWLVVIVVLNLVLLGSKRSLSGAGILPVLFITILVTSLVAIGLSLTRNLILT